MQGSAKVLSCLNKLLAGELAARDQYFIHARMCHEWGYDKLYEHINHEMEEETGHASTIIARILLLEGTPQMTPETLNVGKDVQSILENDLKLELSVREALKQGIALCEAEHDYISRELLVEQLKDTEEDHAHWLEQQLFLIKQMGLQNYLQSKA